ncbi:amidohydrolase 2 [Rhizodiscina lignyota]|uniref:6-methylsalicylate decarboxylase n=1 Tax=Rhizodiscina lignyota TaxID=1504668 RepID=A0A9P4MBT8_9PEZI|nr:amidohydrolase 2 [Rhizodiscina lignyota]
MSKIDVHHHFYPSFFSEAIIRNGGDPSGWHVPDWSADASREISARIGVKTAILSMTAPGAMIERDPKDAAALARRGNLAGAELRDSDPEHFGFYANLPSLLDTETCLAELAFALDELHADGVVIFTRYGDDNHYLGHPDFISIWKELNRRKVVVFIHPTHAVDTHLVNPSLPQPMFDYPHETGHTAIDMIVSGTLKNYAPDCKIILSHAGGTLPYLIYRVAGMIPYTQMNERVKKSTEEIVEEAKMFYFDTAISANEITLKALLALAKPGHILFGSDFPNAPTKGIEFFRKSLDEFEMDKETRKNIEYGAAHELFPRLKV